jgi:hypothetical protein
MTKLRIAVVGVAAAAAAFLPCLPASAATTASASASDVCPNGVTGSAPLATGNFLGNIIIGAFDVARVGIDAAEGIALTAVGAGGTPAGSC